MDTLGLYALASEWTLGKVSAAAVDLDAPTPCDGWDVRTLMNHMLETQQYFVGSAQGLKVAPPGQEPPEIIGDDPVTDFLDARSQVLRTFGNGAAEHGAAALGIAFADQLLHGWDLARASHQDDTMPDGLAEAAYETIHGRFTDEQRKGVFGPEIPVDDDAPAQARLLAYSGRDPASPD